MQRVLYTRKFKERASFYCRLILPSVFSLAGVLECWALSNEQTGHWHVCSRKNLAKLRMSHLPCTFLSDMTVLRTSGHASLDINEEKIPFWSDKKLLSFPIAQKEGIRSAVSGCVHRLRDVSADWKWM